jgi:hypothetical protein
MRYLYGDSVPFPLQYNFLATLEAFTSAAARSVQLDAETRAMQHDILEAASARLKGVEALETFHQAVMRTIQETAARMTQQQTLEYARQVAELAARIVDEHRRNAIATNDRETQHVRMEVDRRRGEIRGALEAFLKVARFPVLASKVSYRWQENHSEMNALYTHPDGLMTAFTLTPTRDWQMPRKVGEIAQGLDLNVGVKKSWFKGTVAPEVVHVDDFLVSWFEVSEEHCELRLRKKIAEKDTLTFKVRRFDDETVAEVGHPGDPNAGSLPPTVESGDKVQLERLWAALRQATIEAQNHRDRLLRVALDGEDVFEADKVLAFVQRIVGLFAPTVAEIAKRSPNKMELSLKLEGDGGRREEIYVRKDDLIAKLQPLADGERKIFAPLQLF